MTEDVIEVCGGCGKLPREGELQNGNFSCTRCGHAKLLQVTSAEFDLIVPELDRTFLQSMIKRKMDDVFSLPLECDTCRGKLSIKSTTNKKKSKLEGKTKKMKTKKSKSKKR
jgi:hypothetical protein